MKLKNKILLVLSVLCVLIAATATTSRVHAEDATITIILTPNGNVKAGETVTADIIVSGDSIANYTIGLDYSSGILQYNSGAENTGYIDINGTGPTTLTYSFTALADGRATISTRGNNVYDAQGNMLSIAHASAAIIVGEETEEAQADDGVINIANDKYTLVNEYQLPKQPEGYKLSSVNYNGKEIYAYQAPDQKLKVVCLQNADGEQKWFVFDEDKQAFSPFIEYSLEGVKYIIINKPDDVKLPDGFEESNLTLNNMQFTAYTDSTDSGIYLIYAINQRGDSGLYYYDTDEGSFTKYETFKKVVDVATANTAEEIKSTMEKESAETTTEVVQKATPLIADDEKESSDEEEGLVSRDTLKNLLTMMIVLFVIMCIVVIILVIKNGSLQNQIYGDEMDEDEDEEDLVARAKKDARKKSEEEEKQKEEEKPHISRNKGYAVNEDTGEILIEEAEDNNSSVNVPPAQDNKKSKIKDEMEKKPFGIDSAFSVAVGDEIPQGENVYHDPEPEGDVVPQETVEKIRREKTEAYEEENLKAESSSGADGMIDSAFVQDDDPEKTKADTKEIERKELVDAFFADDEAESKKKKNRKNRRNRKNRNKAKNNNEAAADSAVETKAEVKPETKADEKVEEKTEAKSDAKIAKKETKEKKPEKEPQKVALPGELLEEEE